MIEAIYGIRNLGLLLSDSTQCCWHEMNCNTKQESNEGNSDAKRSPHQNYWLGLLELYWYVNDFDMTKGIRVRLHGCITFCHPEALTCNMQSTGL